MVFLAEAFTSPARMYALAKAGFSQSYTYFTWKNSAATSCASTSSELAGPVSEFFRPNFFVNTPGHPPRVPAGAAAGRPSRPGWCSRRPCRRATASTPASRTWRRSRPSPAARSTSTRRSTRPRSAASTGRCCRWCGASTRSGAPRRALGRIDVRFLETANPALIAYAKGTGLRRDHRVRQRRPARRPGGHRDWCPDDLGLPGALPRPRPDHAARSTAGRVGAQLRPARPCSVTHVPRPEGGGMSVDRLASSGTSPCSPRATTTSRTACSAPTPWPSGVAVRVWRPEATRRCRALPEGGEPVELPHRASGLFEAVAARRDRRRRATRWRWSATAAIGARPRPVLVPADARRARPAPGRRGPPPGAVGAPRRPPARDRRRRGHGLRGVGAVGALGERGGRLERLGRPRAPDALARARRASGSCSCPASGPGAHYKFEIRGADGVAAPEGRPRWRSAAETPPAHGLDGLRSRATPGGTGPGWRRAPERRPHAEPVSIYEVHLPSWRWNPRRGQPPPDLPRARATSSATTPPTWASPTWSCCR